MIIYHNYKHLFFSMKSSHSILKKKKKKKEYRTEQVNVDVSNLKPQKIREYIKFYLFSDFD